MKYRIRRAKERTLRCQMRFPVYNHSSNPATDRPLLRKKIGYIEELIGTRQAYWIDESQKYKGVQLRAKTLAKGDNYELALTRAAGSGFESAWHILQSGGPDPIEVNGEMIFGGALVWQLRPNA